MDTRSLLHRVIAESGLTRDGVILDIETLDLRRGSGWHEASVLDLQTGRAREILLTPNQVLSHSGRPQDLAGFAHSPRDRHVYHPRIQTWRDAITAHAYMVRGDPEKALQVPGLEPAGFRSLVEESSPWLAGNLADRTYPHLPGFDAGEAVQDPKERLRRIRSLGGRVTALETFSLSPREALSRGSPFISALQDRVIWGYNMNFESKQLGAHLAALEGEEVDRLVAAGIGPEQAASQARAGLGLRGVVNFQNPKSPDVLYVSGAEVSKARTMARYTGDWGRVFESYLAHTKPGEVRDIMDLLRAHSYYAQELGLAKPGRFYGFSADTGFRLFGSLEEDGGLAMRLFRQAEFHRSLEDTALHEQALLRNPEGGPSRLLTQLFAMREAHRGTDLGRSLLEEARLGRGPLAETKELFRRKEALAPVIEEEGVIQRLSRAWQDLAAQGRIDQETGYESPRWIEQEDALGQRQRIMISPARHESFNNVESLVDYLKRSEQYRRADLDALHLQFREHLVSAGALGAEPGTRILDPDLLGVEARRFESLHGTGRVARHIQGMSEAQLADLFGGSTAVPKALGGAFKGTHPALIAGGAVLGLLYARSVLHASPTPELVPGQNPLLTNYHAWERQQREQGQIPGLPEGGVAGRFRSMTDFGSPYQGIVGTAQVFLDQELFHAREQYQREQFGARHFDPIQGILAHVYGRRGQHQFAHEGVERVSGTAGLEGRNLLQIDLNRGHWKMSFEDADTIVLKRKGLLNSLGGYFGFNRGISFRLAGVDAPETSHGEDSFYTPQPGALDALAFAQGMAKDKDLKLIFDPQNITYGRMVASLSVDGKHLARDLVRAGHAAALPYRSKQQPILPYSSLLKLEAEAQASGVGIHQTGFFQAYYAATGQDRITLNTLARKSKLAESSTLRELAALMARSQEGGFGPLEQRLAGDLNARLRAQDGKFKDILRHPDFQLPARPPPDFLASHGQRAPGTPEPTRLPERRGRYGSLGDDQSLDSTGTSTSAWQQGRLQAYEIYQTQKLRDRERKLQMAAAQKRAGRNLFESPIGHHLY